MAIRNRTTVYINGINLTAYCLTPLTWGNFLDEQLDEMNLILRHCPIKIFSPLTPVEIHFESELYFGENIVEAETEIKQYMIANDSAEESPNPNCVKRIEKK